MKFKKGLASLGPSSGKMKGKIFKVLQPIMKKNQQIDGQNYLAQFVTYVLLSVYMFIIFWTQFINYQLFNPNISYLEQQMMTNNIFVIVTV